MPPLAAYQQTATSAYSSTMADDGHGSKKGPALPSPRHRDAPTHGGVAYSSSDPNYVDLSGSPERPQRSVTVTTVTETEMIRDGNAFVQRTTTTSTCSPAFPPSSTSTAEGAAASASCPPKPSGKDSKRAPPETDEPAAKKRGPYQKKH